MKLKKIYETARKFKRILRRQRCAAVIVAAGSSSRMAGQDKLLADLCGKSVLARTLEAFQTCVMVDEIVVVTRADRLEEIGAVCAAYKKVRIVVPGGETRTDSVMAGIAAVSKKMALVAVHDGARPLVSDEVICAAIEKAEKFGAAAPAIAVKDTIKVTKNNAVDYTPDRSTLCAIQTPQVFDCDLLRGALQNAKNKNLAVTDDCSAVEALGMTVFLTKGSEENIKITTPLDLDIAAAILNRRDADADRTRI